MIVFESPETPDLETLYNEDIIKVFLAGGISKCPDWQAETIKYLNEYRTDDMVIFNPRNSNFDINNKRAAEKQIEWEFKYLSHMDMFTMYFCNSESNQPICMYELGRYTEIMKHRFPEDWKYRIVVSIEDGYSRTKDVITQFHLATGMYPELHMTPGLHAQTIVNRALNLVRM